jgi:hypothetical protein
MIGLATAPGVPRRWAPAHREVGPRACLHALQHLGVGRGEHHAAAGQLPVPQQRTQQPRIERQAVVDTGDGGDGVDPEPVAISPPGQQRADLGRRQDPRLPPRAIVDAPQMLGTALGGTAVAEGDPVHLALALREDAGHA